MPLASGTKEESRCGPDKDRGMISIRSGREINPRVVQYTVVVAP